MVIDEIDNHNIYMQTTDTQISTKEIVTTIIVILLIFSLIGLIMIAKNSMMIIQQSKIFEQYKTQLMVLQKQEEERKAEIERRIQEKMPKLTQARKR